MPVQQSRRAALNQPRRLVDDYPVRHPIRQSRTTRSHSHPRHLGRSDHPQLPRLVRSIGPRADRHTWLAIPRRCSLAGGRASAATARVRKCSNIHPSIGHTFRAFDRTGVDTAGKHHGMHALRHSAATNMLAGGTAYPVICGILGHSNANTTRKYMAIDIEALRVLSLEVPRG